MTDADVRPLAEVALRLELATAAFERGDARIGNLHIRWALHWWSKVWED